ncbi:Rib/alpha-like domain-containing protein, partial [Corynebacterium sp.]|uniref:Rib/alpha-like domain-containing protein n=1 Tax=Corynebacterium sp. TaxID=1720 RepID=UPI002A913B3B
VNSALAWKISGGSLLEFYPTSDQTLGENRVEVTATYSDGTIERATLLIVVEPSIATMVEPNYGDPIRVTQGHPIGVNSPSMGGNDGKFTRISELPSWLDLREDGSMILSPSADVASGTYKGSAQVRYQDNSIETFEFEVEVVKAEEGVDPITRAPADLAVVPFVQTGRRVNPETGEVTYFPAGVGIFIGGVIWEVPPTLPELPEEPSVTPPEQPETPGEDTPEQPETPVAPPVDTGSFDEPVDATCVAVASAVGIPMLLLVPFALATDLEIPGMAPLARDVSARIASANSEIQKTMGIHDPHLSRAASEFNARVTSALNSREARGAATVATAALVFAAAVGGACAPVGGASISSAS